ncbi:MAG: M20 family metallopeptidase [Actinomycetota bacterium]|nr:M20 family metallopeptidase [Actinomycetota bacterium]
MSRKQDATDTFSAIETELRSISRWMYENPELAFEEFNSSKRLVEFLSGNGFDVTYPAYGLETAFEANAGTTGPRVVICAEYDALPGVGHACGHNIIATSSLGAGVAVATMAEELGIRVTVLGTPAEEGGGGKIDLINAGAFEDAAASMLIHPSPRNLADPRLLAAQGMTVEFHGKEAHAAATPHVGINALDAFVQAYNNVSTLRQHFEAGDRVHGVIDEGGLAPNVIPAYTSARWLVRASTAERFEQLKAKVMACFEAAAMATGCELTITAEGEPYEDLVSSLTLTELFAANAKAIGRAMPTFAESGEMTYASSDMGNVSHVVPSIHPSMLIETTAVNHQPEFAAATITPSGEQAIRDGALAMAHTIIDQAEQDLWDSL